MVAYGIGVIPLIKRPKSAHHDVTHTCYADDDGELGTFDKLERHFNSLKRHILEQGYYPEPTKNILIVHPKNI